MRVWLHFWKKENPNLLGNKNEKGILMKKRWLLVLVAMFVLLLIACGDNSNSSVDDLEADNTKENTDNTGSDNSGEFEEQTFRLNAGLSSEDNNTAAFTIPWMEEIEEATSGKVTFEAFFSEELVTMGEEVRALKDGTIDIAAPVLPSYNPDQFPLSDVIMLPLVHSDSKIAAKAFADLVKSDKDLQDGKTFTEIEYGQHGMKALPVQPVAEYTIGFVSKNDIQSASDLQNLSLRTGGRAHEIFVSQLGSGSVSMPWSEEFEALSRGAIDGNVRSVQDYAAYGFDEMITQSLEGISIGHFPFIWLMEENKWNELPDNLKQLMEETAYGLADSEFKNKAQIEAVEEAKENGIEFVDVANLDQDAQDLLEEASINTWNEWIESKEKEGYPGLETAKLWRDLIIENGGEVYESVLELE